MQDADEAQAIPEGGNLGVGLSGSGSAVAPVQAPGRGRRRRSEDAAAESSGMYGQVFTRDEVQRLVQAATAPLLDEEVRLLQVLIQRVAANGQDPGLHEGRPEDGAAVRQRQRAVLIEKLSAVGRAVDVLQRTLKTRQALATASADALWQLLDEAAAFVEDEPAPADRPGQEKARKESYT